MLWIIDYTTRLIADGYRYVTAQATAGRCCLFRPVTYCCRSISRNGLFPFSTNVESHMSKRIGYPSTSLRNSWLTFKTPKKEYQTINELSPLRDRHSSRQATGQNATIGLIYLGWLTCGQRQNEESIVQCNTPCPGFRIQIRYIMASTFSCNMITLRPILKSFLVILLYPEHGTLRK